MTTAVQPRIFIDCFGQPKSNAGWAGPASQSSTSLFGGNRDSTGGQNSEIVFPVRLAAGTYSLDLFHKKGTNRAIYTIYLNDVLLTAYGAVGASAGALTGATIDGYNASTTSATDTITGIVIATEGLYDLKLKLETKNAAASANYVGSICGVVLTNPT